MPALQVLLLEDRAADAELVLIELRKAGFVPDWQRVETLHDFRVRLTPSLECIIADYTLPGFTAIDALKALRETGLDLPFLIVSGSIGEDRAVECLKAGVTDYVLKDRMARLGPAVQRALEEARIRRENRRTHEDLRRNEEQMRSILTTVEDVVWSLSLVDGRLLYLNPAAEKLAGRPVQEFLEDQQKWLDLVHPEDRERLRVAQDKAIRWGTYETEYRILRPDGAVREVLLRAWAAYAPDGRAVRLEGIVTDVTEKKSHERQRRELDASRRESERLARENQFKSMLMATVAHDLNNVVSPLRIALGTLRNGLASGQQATMEQAAKSLDRSVVRIGAFLADLLDAARIQAGALQIRPVDLDLSAAVREAVDAAKAEAPSRGLEVAAMVEDGVRVPADPHRVQQVLSNLLSNALKFTPSGGRVTVTLAAVADGARVDVADTGPGIREEDQERLFQPFSKIGTRPQGQHTGTGLGLSICKAIVEEHHGRLWCASKPGAGATFSFLLPKP